MIVLRHLGLIRKHRLIRIGVNHPVLIPEPILVKRDFLIRSPLRQLVTHNQNHSRLQTPLPQHRPTVSMRCRNPRKLHGQKIKPRPIKRFDIIHIRLHRRNRLTRLKRLLHFLGRLINEEKARKLLRPQLQVIKNLPGKQLTLTGRVHISRNRNLITTRQTGLDGLQRIRNIFLFDSLPRKIRLNPRKIIQLP